ncbi:MAG: cell division protein FtsZ [Bacteroidetes bacterium]|nr:cell division protein FtsZ [Bacteroidota bacterium]
MIHFDLPKQKSSIIKVFGIGGGGSNAVNYMYSQNIEGVDFVVCNTDAKAIDQSPVLNKIQLGPASTMGLGAGANPEVGKLATEESLQEIKNILEVNTRMAFITAGMGGGTGTGGAPIVAQICKELGILTVGIVTTPFSFEGPKRMQQAKEGIEALKPHVDTLLVINNDKLRMQYGNLKMKEAFSKADDVLATASKCITDIINSKGHIIVDFADVCTVMKNGGVAILGSATVEGENRAQVAIEEALSSPLLNDNEIRGAKWILININSAEGDYECTMDEIDLINEFLRTQTGENTDVILGMGIDNTLDKKIGITIIATGFHHKDPFSKESLAKAKPAEAKIVLTLDSENAANEKKVVIEQPVAMQQQAIPFEDKNPYAPQLVETAEHQIIGYESLNSSSYSSTDFDALKDDLLDVKETEIFELELSTSEAFVAPYLGAHTEVEKSVLVDSIATETLASADEIVNEVDESSMTMKIVENTVSTASLLSKPSNIYSPINENKVEEIKEEQKPENVFEWHIKETPTNEIISQNIEIEEEQPIALHFEVNTREEVVPQPITFLATEDLSEEEQQRKRAVERIQKLRNLSFNISSADAANDYDSIPAYIRQKMEIHGNTLTTVESYYSRATVDKNSKDEVVISQKNSFLDGNRPD